MTALKAFEESDGKYGIPAGVERVLVVTAHPDDVDFGAGGTVATLTDLGIQVTYCICTDGDAGGFDDATDRSAIPGIRRAEQTAAGKELGVTDIHFLGYKDGYLEPNHDVQRDIVRVMRKVKPQLVMTQSTERNWERLPATHPDHMAAGEATVRALYPAVRNPYAYPELRNEEGLEAWTVTWLWLQGTPQPDHWLDITEQFDRKLRAIKSHDSQVSHLDTLEDMTRGWATMWSEKAGLPTGRLAEGFKQVRLPD